MVYIEALEHFRTTGEIPEGRPVPMPGVDDGHGIELDCGRVFALVNGAPHCAAMPAGATEPRRYTRVPKCTVVRGSQSAVLVRLPDGREVWFPRSTLHEDSVAIPGDEGVLAVERWKADREGVREPTP